MPHSLRMTEENERPQKETEEIYTKLDFSVAHVQVDDMVSERFRVIFSPVQPLKKTPFESQEEEKGGEEDDETPFI